MAPPALKRLKAVAHRDAFAICASSADGLITPLAVRPRTSNLVPEPQ
eukprot:CAMPEP_0197681930 /NCGR_PEP_ID=MMETSP1338-20131121/95700_1 /TAXON_ID=43686 ORGANISM="Pelagodinium beii, Strain RCC1491" /NCGR_SAMPLE_ID=MMETSP1338 /ASSEMBLY_ACC=CAM_ASM_000754 /LENGTH=46 /DNA_ID= /DNA_START= /DNA_END= /DNA_ORIENTATION=